MMDGAPVGIYRPAIMCFSHLRWDFVWQRPQQLLSRAASTFDIIFFEEPVRAPLRAPEPRLRTVLPGVTVAHLDVPHHLPDTSVAAACARYAQQLASGRRELLLWYYTPMALSLGRDIEAGFRIYDCMDDLASFRHAPPGMQKNEEQLLATVDLVLAGGISLYESRRIRHPNVHLFPSSVDARHFAQARAQGIDPPDQAAIAGPKIGYFGVIDERLDLGLIASLAAMRREWHFVFIGPTAKVDPADLPNGPNIHWLGMKPYADLPAYLRGWSAGFMPFARNEATRYISPTKTPEFLAAGLPLVSTRIKDVESLYGDLVAFADEPAAFDAALAGASTLPRASWLAKVDERLAGQSWDATWAGIAGLLPLQASAPRGSAAKFRANA